MTPARLWQIVSALLGALLLLVSWLATDALARIDTLEGAHHEAMTRLAAVQATQQADSARLARIEALLDQRLPVPRLDVTPPR